MSTLRQTRLLVENLIGRDRYLSGLGNRIGHFKEVYSSSSRRVIDDIDVSHGNVEFSIPEVSAADFRTDILKNAMQQKGCLIVRDFFSSGETAKMKDYIDYAFAVCNGDRPIEKYLAKKVDLGDLLEKTKADIVERQKTNNTYADTTKLGRNLTQALNKDRSLLTVRSPLVAEKILALFEKKGLKKLMNEYFENEPCASIYKWVLRKVKTERAIDFHQDGAFMGDEIDSLNCWIPLSDCGPGNDAPGLDVVPVRLMKTFAKGSGMLDWSISSQAVIDHYGEQAIVSPVFNKGDLLLFDHLLIHRPQYDPDHSQERYAIETWFFDSHNFPKNQLPVQW